MEQALKIEPHILVFEKTDRYSSNLILHNVSEKFIAIRIKSNDTQLIDLKPSTYVLKPGSRKPLQINLTREVTNLHDLKLQVISGFINQNDDCENFFRTQKNLWKKTINCELDISLMKPIISYITPQITPRQPPNSDLEETIKKKSPVDVAEELKKLSEQILEIKQNRNEGLNFKQIAFGIILSILLGMLIRLT